MSDSQLESNSAKTSKTSQIARGKQANAPLNIVIVGGGKACYSFLEFLHDEKHSGLNMKVLGVSDLNPESPGFQYARKVGLFTTTDFKDLFTLEDINLVIELTGSTKVREEITTLKSSGVSVLGHEVSGVIWDLLQIGTEKTNLELEHKQYEINSKNKTQLILDSLPYRIMVVNMDLTVDTVNETFLKELGVTKEQVQCKRCFELRYNLDKPCKEAGLICYLEDKLDDLINKGSFSAIREIEDEKGEARFEVITTAPIFDDEGELVQILEASRDITERIKLEKEIQKSYIFFENLIKSTVDGIVVVDTKGNVLIFNEGMEKLTGYPKDEIINTSLSSFYDFDVAKENMKKMRSHEHGPVDKLNPTSMFVKTKDGDEIPVTLSASIIKVDGEEIGSVGIFTDMREVLKMRKKLEEAHIQLVQSEKIASVGRMAAGVAHEINNPLSGVLLYAELLKDDLKDQPERLNDIQEIIGQTLRCKKIVSEMLEFSRQSVGKTSSFSLQNMISQCLNLLINQALFQDIKVVKEIEPDMPEIVGDMGQLQQVFTNLFINAAHAMESKGRLGIKAHFNKQDSCFNVIVSDTGPGIPAELRDKVFDIFFTTKPVGKGTGLGLSISQNIIKLHGGTITFECPPEGGTIFTIEIPLEFSEDTPTEEPVFI